MHFFLRKSTRHQEDFFKTGPLQGFTSKEPGPSLTHQAKPVNKEAFEFNHKMLEDSTRCISSGIFFNFPRKFSGKILQLFCSKQQEARGLHPVGVLFQKGTHHLKISRSATRFHSRKHLDDACSYSTRPKGTRRGFQSSTMKCLGACQCGTHGIPRKEERRSSLTRIPPM